MQTVKSIFIKIIGVFWKIWFGLAKYIGSLVLLVLIMLFLGTLISSSNKAQSSRYPSKVITSGSEAQVAIINLAGEISHADSGGFGVNSSMIDAKRTTDLLKHLEKQEDIKGVIIDINSPGGTVVASDEIYHQIKKLSENKVVIARLSNTAASGGYYIALAADKIVANKSTITGSIGVIAQMPKLSGLFEKLGVQMYTVKSGDHKDIGSPYKDFSEEENEIFQSVIDDSYDQFLQLFIENRNLDEAKARSLADGRIYTGVQAFDHGMIDQLGNLPEAIELMKSELDIDDPTIIEYSSMGFLESFLQSKAPSFFSIESPISFREGFGVYYLAGY